MIFSLAHCALCDCWLTSCESCLHIQAIDDAGRGLPDADRLRAPVSFLHADTTSLGEQRNHA